MSAPASPLRTQGRRVWIAVYASLADVREGVPLAWERGTWLSPLAIYMDARHTLTFEPGPARTLYAVGTSGYRYVWHDADDDFKPLCKVGPSEEQRKRPLDARGTVQDTDCTIFIEHASEVLECAGCRKRKAVEADALRARLGMAGDYERGVAEQSQGDHLLREQLRLRREQGPARHTPAPARWRGGRG